MRAAVSNRRGRRGFTLIELVIVLGLLGLVFGALVRVLDSSNNNYEQGSAVALVENEARRALDRVVAELENAGATTLLPNPVGIACNDQVYQVATGIDAATATVLYGTSSRLRFAYEQGELDNGVDDDTDGLIDEGCIELTMDFLGANQQVVVIAHGIPELLEGEIANGGDDNGNGLNDERGFCVTRVGNLLRVRISVVRPVRGNLAIATVDTAIRLKN